MRILRRGHTTLLTEWREHDRGKLTKSKMMLSGLSLNEWMSNSVMKGVFLLYSSPRARNLANILLLGELPSHNKTSGRSDA